MTRLECRARVIADYLAGELDDFAEDVMAEPAYLDWLSRHFGIRVTKKRLYQWLNQIRFRYRTVRDVVKGPDGFYHWKVASCEQVPIITTATQVKPLKS